MRDERPIEEVMRDIVKQPEAYDGATLARSVIETGDRSLDLVSSYMKEVSRELPQILWRLREERLTNHDSQTIADVVELFRTLSDAAQPDGQTDFQIVFKRRRGRPREKSVVYLRWNLAAEHIDRSLAEGNVSVKEAVYDACKWSGLRESQVKAARSVFGKASAKG